MAQHYKKDGSLDMRYSSSRAAVASGSGYSSGGGYRSGYSGGGNYNCSSNAGSYGISSSNYHYKQDGSLDMRYSSSRAAASGASVASPCNARPETRCGLGDLHYKKDGALDMRYASSKVAVNEAQSSNDLHYKKDGSLDMRYSSSRAASGASLASSKAAMNAAKSGNDLHCKKDGSLDMRYSSSKRLSDAMAHLRVSEVPSHVPLTKSGAPDMRTKAAKDWVLQQAQQDLRDGDLPSWVPTRKDGTVDSTKPIGRIFAEHRPMPSHPQPQVDRRQMYWEQRKQDPVFIDRLRSERTEPVIMPRAFDLPNLSSVRSTMQSIVAEEQLSRSTTPQQMPSSLPDSVTLISYSELSLGEELGRGAFGVVYKATYNGQTVAVKQLLLDRLNKREAQSFRKEVAILAYLGSHPNLVEMLGCVQEPPCIVLQYVELGSLGNLLHYCTESKVEVKMTDGRIKKRLMLGTVDGMRQLHAVGVVHADLKPQNVLVTADYQAKITDFGLSRLRGKTNSCAEIASASGDVQKETFIGGTSAYMAPELLESSAEPAFSVDVYAFGIMLNEVISEQEPYCDQHRKFMGRGVYGLVNYARLGNRPTISPTTPTNVVTLMMDCWSAKADSRPTFKQIFASMNNESFVIPDSVTL